MTAIAFGPVPSRRLGEGWAVVEMLLAGALLARREHGGRTSFVRRFARPASAATADATPGRMP